MILISNTFKKLTLTAFAAIFTQTLSLVTMGQTPVPMSSQPGLSYTEDFSDIANWTNNFTAGTGANRFGSVAVNATGTIPDGVRTTASTATFQTTGTSGGVQRGSLAGNPAGTIVLLSTGATDNTAASAIDFLMDYTGVNAGTLSFDWASVNNQTGNRSASLKVYWSVNGTTFTEISAAQVLNFTNNAATSGNITTVALPAAFSNSPTARLRFYEYNATGGTTGSRPKISLDNLTVTATAIGPTAADAVVSGRVVNANNRGLANVRVTISGGSLMQPISALTNGFGYYTLTGVPAGATYIVEAASKVYTFSQPTTVQTVNGDLSDVNFIGEGR